MRKFIHHDLRTSLALILKTTKNIRDDLYNIGSRLIKQINFIWMTTDQNIKTYFQPTDMNSSVQNRIFVLVPRGVHLENTFKKEFWIKFEVEANNVNVHYISVRHKHLMWSVCRVKRTNCDAQCRRQSVTATSRLALTKGIHEVFIVYQRVPVWWAMGISAVVICNYRFK